MQTPDRTIDHGTLRRLLDAGAHVGAEVIGAIGGWGVVINYGRASQTLSATRGQPRTWRQFETRAGYLTDLGITEVRVNTAEFEPRPTTTGKQDKRSIAASDRMKRAHQAATYDTWFREQVKASIDDQRPSIDDEQARKQFAAKRAALAKRATPKKAAAH